MKIDIRTRIISLRKKAAKTRQEFSGYHASDFWSNSEEEEIWDLHERLVNGLEDLANFPDPPDIIGVLPVRYAQKYWLSGIRGIDRSVTAIDLSEDIAREVRVIRKAIKRADMQDDPWSLLLKRLSKKFNILRL
ncbi:hypothetical protein AB1L88_03975 [Tautonia sp. JC769]|uniref:hypothetical protein n=1 Tax=Tautonia sp. JC769 TaxID=3232135 RepID=UPI003458C14D